MSNTPFVSSQDLVDALRSSDPKTRQAAIDHIFPDCGALMLATTPQATQCTTTTKVDPSTLFSGTLFVQQQLGRMLGLDLRWVPSAEDDSKKLIVAPPGSFR